MNDVTGTGIGMFLFFLFYRQVFSTNSKASESDLAECLFVPYYALSVGNS